MNGARDLPPTVFHCAAYGWHVWASVWLYSCYGHCSWPRVGALGTQRLGPSLRFQVLQAASNTAFCHPKGWFTDPKDLMRRTKAGHQHEGKPLPCNPYGPHVLLAGKVDTPWTGQVGGKPHHPQVPNARSLPAISKAFVPTHARVFPMTPKPGGSFVSACMHAHPRTGRQRAAAAEEHAA
jgi:hypothetical protein